MFRRYNANPIGRDGIDCTVRAISVALGQDWRQTYMGIAVEGYALSNMPSANHVWSAYLRKKGFKRYIIPDELPEDYTVSDFCRDNPTGTYILALSGHVVAVINGDWIDTWDSGNEIPIYYYAKEKECF